MALFVGGRLVLVVVDHPSASWLTPRRDARDTPDASAGPARGARRAIAPAGRSPRHDMRWRSSAPSSRSWSSWERGSAGTFATRSPSESAAAPAPTTTGIKRTPAGSTTWIYPGAADAVYELARHVETRSEISVRIHAAPDAFDHAASTPTRSRRPHPYLRLRRASSTRPQAAPPRSRTSPPIPQPPRSSPSPPASATHCSPSEPTSSTSLRAAGSSPDRAGPSHAARTAPLAGHLEVPLGGRRPHRAVPLFPTIAAVAARPRSRRTLQALDAAPREDRPDTEIGTGDGADGRALLHRLTACNLWHDRRHQASHRAGPPDPAPLTRGLRFG